MDTIRPYIWIGVWGSLTVCLLWLLLGGLFSAVSSIVPYAWVIIVVAIVVGMVAWVLRYPATEINTLGDNKLVWGIFQTVMVVGFIVLFIQAVLWVNSNEFLLWTGIDSSPRVQWFMSVVVVSLCLFPLPPLINWVIPTSGIFASAVWRTLLATSFLLLVASVFLPKTLFDPITGAPLATVDSEGNTFYSAKKYSPATGEELKPITTEEAKKIRPWWERWWATIEKWNIDRHASAEYARKSNAGVVTPAPWNPAKGRRQEASTEVINPTDPDVIRQKLDKEWFTHLKVVVRSTGGEVVTTPFMRLPECLPRAQFWYDVLPRNTETVVRVKDKRGQLWEVNSGDYKSGPLPAILRGDLLVQIETRKEVVLVLNCFT